MVICYYGDNLDKASVFRSHSHDNTDLTRQYPHFRLQPASNARLWEIGRATIATPSLFAPMQMEGQTIFDGTIGEFKNPAKRAYSEVKDAYPRHEPCMIISIGTGEVENSELSVAALKAMTSRPDTTKAMQNLFNLAGDPQRTHRSLERAIEGINKEREHDERVLYHRFNIPANILSDASSLSGLDLFEWRGHDGSETRDRISREFLAYLSVDGVADKLDNCARKLLEIRRRRQQTVHWDYFTLSTSYHCPYANCAGFRPTCYRIDLRSHLQREHAIFAPVPEDNTWMCSLATCLNATPEVAFESLNELRSHLRKDHGRDCTTTRTAEQMKHILDKCRLHTPGG